MSKVKEMWERVQEMFRQPSDLERWISAGDLDHLMRQWNHKQYHDIY